MMKMELPWCILMKSLDHYFITVIFLTFSLPTCMFGVFIYVYDNYFDTMLVHVCMHAFTQPL